MQTRRKRVEGYSIAVCLVFVIALFVLFSQAQAVDYNVGVKVGDWIKYGQITVTQVGNGTGPLYLSEGAEKIDWIRVEVEGIQGTEATFNATWHYNNDTQTYMTTDSDVENDALNAYAYLIASSLSSGDPIENSSASDRISETITARYAGADRKINVFNFTSTINGHMAENTRYWDQSTGIMVEWYLYAPYQGGYTQVSMRATETNIWSPDFFGIITSNLPYVVAAIAILITAIICTVILTRKKTQRQQPPQPSVLHTVLSLFQFARQVM